MLLIEWVALMMYAGGGKSLSVVLSRGQNVRLINRIAGTLMLVVGVWLALG